MVGGGMSTVLSMSFFPSDGNAPKAYRDLFLELTKTGTVRSVSLHRASWGENPPIDSSAFQITDPLIDKVSTSSDCLEIFLHLQLSFGYSLSCSLHLIGHHYQGGFPQQVNGPIRLVFSLQDLQPTVVGLGHTDELLFSEMDSTQQLAVEAIEQLFVRGCAAGMETRDGSDILHAGVYLENGWPSPAECAMFYHRDIQEFAIDFVRIYLSYHAGGFSPATFLLVNHDNKLKLDFPDAQTCRQDTESFLGQYPRSVREGAVTFFRELRPDSVRRLLKVSAEDLYLLLPLIHPICQRVRCIATSPGIILSATPASLLWSAYARLAALVQ